MSCIVFGESDAAGVALFVSRLLREVPEARLKGIIFRQPASSRSSPDHFGPGTISIGDHLLSWLHGCPLDTTNAAALDGSDPSEWTQRFGCQVQVIRDWNAKEAIDLVRTLSPVLGIYVGTAVDRTGALAMPHHGVLHTQIWESVGDSTPGRGLTEPQAKERHLNIGVFREAIATRKSGPLACESLTLGPYETQTGLCLKVDLLRRDLLIRALSKIRLGTTDERLTDPPELVTEEAARIAKSIPGLPASTYRVQRGRPTWKLLLRTLLLAPYVVARNWIRRARGRFPVIVLYHHLVADRPSHIGIPTEEFWKHARFLRRHYDVVSLTEAIEMLRSGRVSRPTIVLTFDDGYRDNFVNLRAITERLQLPAVLFISTEHISNGKEFEHDVKRNQRGFLPLSWEQVIYLSKYGYEFGSHTRTHFDCGSTDLERLKYEISGSKQDLEARLGFEPQFFSFPWGRPENMSADAVKLAEATFTHYFSAHDGANFPARSGEFRHLLRPAHGNDLWELELTLQSILDF